VDFFIAPHIFGDDFGDLDESGDEKEDEWDSPEAKQHISRKSTGNPLEIHWKSTGNGESKKGRCFWLVWNMAFIFPYIGNSNPN
jgi:hypothetical protein